ncbi:hypothetical protein HRbin36_01109 [bacterium HR36]|nr:hypothetical protein HRbin36_01109 [bacterium HR36]
MPNAADFLGDHRGIGWPMGRTVSQAPFAQLNDFRLCLATRQAVVSIVNLPAQRFEARLFRVVFNVWWLACEDLTEYRSQTENIAAGIHQVHLSRRLFWCHISWGAHHSTRLRLAPPLGTVNGGHGRFGPGGSNLHGRRHIS